MTLKKSQVLPPVAQKHEVTHEKHGDKRSDPYFWMNQRDKPEVLSYLKEENNYLESVLKDHKELRTSLFEEMKARIPKDNMSAPLKRRGYFYYSREEGNKDYSIHCRKKDNLKSPEEVILDENLLAKGQEFFNISSLKVSPSNKIVAYSKDLVGRRIYTLSLHNLETGKTEEDVLTGASGDLIWGADDDNLYFTRRNTETLRSYELWHYNLQTKKETLLFHEEDETFMLQVSKSLTDRYLFLASHSTLTTEILYLDLKEKEAQLKVFSKRKKGLEYSVDDGGDRFYILSNRDEKNFSLMETSSDKTDSENWKTSFDQDPKVFLDSFHVSGTYLALRESHEGLLKIKIVHRETGQSHYLETKDESCDIDVYANPEFSSSKLNYTYESLSTPYSIISYDVFTKESEVLKQEKVLGKFDSNDYISKRIFAEARDGEMIPVSLVYRKDTKLKADTPLLQYAYGSYGLTIHPYFSPQRLSLLDRGFVFALCHIRGSSYKGRPWYEEGKMQKKKNTFYDFIDCSQFFINQGYTSSEHLYAQGGSAGGLLMGAVLNMAPELYKGMISQVPFVDVMTTMLDDTIPLTTFEYDEWGNPNKKDDYHYMRSYSPYDNVEKKNYTNLLVTTGYHDSQVQYWEPAKWVARLREFKTCDSLLLFHTNFSSGHGGSSGRFEHLKDVALTYAFLLYLEEGKRANGF